MTQPAAQKDNESYPQKSKYEKDEIKKPIRYIQMSIDPDYRSEEEVI
jgi:hypothetical protein